MKTQTLGLVLVGVLLGSCTASVIAPQPTKTEFLKIPGKTKVVYETKEVPGETVYIHDDYPESCLKALDLADIIARESELLYDYGDEQLAIVSDARMSLAEGGDLSAIENRQRKLQGKTVGALADLEEAYYQYGLEEEACREELK